MYSRRSPDRIVSGYRGLTPVIAYDVCSPKAAIKALTAVSGAIGVDGICFGGALRDHIDNERHGKSLSARDIDLAFDIRGGFHDLDKEQADELIQDAITALRRECDDFKFIECKVRLGRKASIKVQFGDDILDISLLNGDVSAQEYASNADTPLNGVAMDINETIFTHPNFETDLEKNIWNIIVQKNSDVRDSIRRFMHQRKKRPGLVLQSKGYNVAEVQSDFNSVSDEQTALFRSFGVEPKSFERQVA